MHTHAAVFIQDLAIIMLVAGLITVICQHLKQPIVFGYIIAGVIVGPYTPPFSLVSDAEVIKTLAELGVIFLMFSLGLEFNLLKLAKVGLAAFIAAFTEIIIMIVLGYTLGCLFGWSQLDAIFLGAILSISSTTIIVKALSEMGLNKEKFAQLIYGILILEDVFAILILALLSSIAVSGKLNTYDVVITVSKLSSFLVISLLVGILIVPHIIAYIAKFRSSEMLLISVLGLCFGFCLLVLKMEYSVALGAFLIGAIMAESVHLHAIEKLIAPIRDMFSAIFFVSVGLLFNPNVVLNYFSAIIIITLVVVFGKVLSSSLSLIVMGKDPKTSVRVGMGLAQIGEFSFIIASLGIALQVTGDFLYSIAVAVSIITTILTPYLIKYSNSVTLLIQKILPNSIFTKIDRYHDWLNAKNHKNKAAKIIKKNIIQILINGCVVMGLFLSGDYAADTNMVNKLVTINDSFLEHTFIWSFALFISLPFLIAIYSKLIEIGGALNFRRFLSKTIALSSMALLMLFIAFLTNIAPPLELLVVILLIVLIALMLVFSWFLRFHTRLHTYLLSSFKSSHK